MWKAFLLLMALVALAACASSQPDPTYNRTPLPDRSYAGEVFQASDSEAMSRLDALPEPAGGMESIQRQILYPETALYLGLQTRVIVGFVVGADGQTYDVHVVRTVDEEEIISLDKDIREALKDLEHHAMRAIWRTEFNPGTIDGTPVAVQTSWPITFRLRDQ